MKLDKIVVASGNAGKIKEIREIFSGYEIVSLAELGFTGDIEETGKSFKENAAIKAATVAEKYNLPVLADDSGICVDALDGAPGIYSARFSGGDAADNRKLLLEKMQGVENRRAHFESAVCLRLPDGREYFGEGRTYGTILREETGKNGFGYDCLFFSDDLQVSFGIATDEEKNAVSHRFRALEELKKLIENL